LPAAKDAAMPTDLPSGATGVLVLADGTVLPGVGCGFVGEAVGEVCFNTAMTGYQEILTDPSYMSQIVAFTFPHVGNVGVNFEDLEQLSGGAERAAVGAVFRARPTPSANWRATSDLTTWMMRRGLVGLSEIDTRALTHTIRTTGMPHGVVAHNPEGRFDIEAMIARARAWPGVDGADLAGPASSEDASDWTEGLWSGDIGYNRGATDGAHVVVVDYGVKRNIARALAAAGARVTIVPAKTSAHVILALRPDGVVLANGPGDPAATAVWAAPVIRELVESGVPMLGVCLGHQLLALALGGRTVKMEQGHHGANHPVKNLASGAVEIVSMNHGFAVDRASLPDTLEETHVSLFDGSNAGLKMKGRPVYSVQHHPEASPGPTDALALFDRFVVAIG
jgi:carbamoyl-phosphate synthase small subunit